MVNRVQKAWVQGMMAGMLLIDVKGAFDNVSRNCLLRTMNTMDSDGHLIQWNEFFISGKSVSLVIDGPTYARKQQSKQESHRDRQYHLSCLSYI